MVNMTLATTRTLEAGVTISLDSRRSGPGSGRLPICWGRQSLGSCATDPRHLIQVTGQILEIHRPPESEAPDEAMTIVVVWCANIDQTFPTKASFRKNLWPH